MENNNGAVRLQKYIADCGLMSRRRAEEEIAAGRIRVNGETVEQGRKIIPETDLVEYCGQKVSLPNDACFLYIMLNKPRGYVTTMSDEMGRCCVASLVSNVGARVYPCGRLDRDSEGLLILTNDGQFANKLMHPRHHIPKRYTVSVKGRVDDEQIRRLNGPMRIDDYDLHPSVVKALAVKEDHSILAFTLFEGRNRQIRKMCETVGLEVINLRRIAIGSISLGNLKRGEWCHLSRAQVEYLKNY